MKNNSGMDVEIGIDETENDFNTWLGRVLSDIQGHTEFHTGAWKW